VCSSDLTKFSRSIYLNYLAKKYSTDNNCGFIDQGCSNEYLLGAFERESRLIKEYDYIFITVGLGTSFAGVCLGQRETPTKIVGLSITKNQKQLQKYLKKRFDFELQEPKESLILLPPSSFEEEEDLDSHYSLRAWHYVVDEEKNLKDKKVLFWNTGRKINA
jgi:hypothetical protein